MGDQGARARRDPEPRPADHGVAPGEERLQGVSVAQLRAPRPVVGERGGHRLAHAPLEDGLETRGDGERHEACAGAPGRLGGEQRRPGLPS